MLYIYIYMYNLYMYNSAVEVTAEIKYYIVKWPKRRWRFWKNSTTDMGISQLQKG